MQKAIAQNIRKKAKKLNADDYKQEQEDEDKLDSNQRTKYKMVMDQADEALEGWERQLKVS